MIMKNLKNIQIKLDPNQILKIKGGSNDCKTCPPPIPPFGLV